MSGELHHECGVLALCWLDKAASRGGAASKPVRQQGGDVVPLVPPMLLDLQNRGQLAAGLSSYRLARPQVLDTCKAVGMVAEAFRMSHPAKCRRAADKWLYVPLSTSAALFSSSVGGSGFTWI